MTSYKIYSDEQYRAFLKNKFSTNYGISEEKAADWFYTVFSLFDGSFGSDMDFSDEDWEELHAIISAAAESLDMHTVSTIMSVMVERHKLL